MQIIQSQLEWLKYPTKCCGVEQIRKEISYLVPHPLLRLRAKLAFFTLWISLWDQMRAEMLAQVLDDCFALSDHSLLFRARRSNANRWRPPKRMHLLHLWSCTELCITLVDLDFILEVQLFEQPDDSLSPRLGKPKKRLVVDK